MANTKISDLPRGSYKDSLLIPTADGDTNTAITASNLRGPTGAGATGPVGPSGPTGPTGSGATDIADLTDAGDVTGTPYGLVGFDGANFPAMVVTPVPNSLVSYDSGGIVGTIPVASLQTLLGVPPAAPSTFSGFDSASRPIAMTRSDALALLGVSATSITVQFPTMSNGTYTLWLRSPGNFLLTSLDTQIATGSFTIAIKVGATTIGGLGSVAVNTPTIENNPASEPNSVGPGDTITATITSATGSPAGVVIGLNLQRL